MPKRHVYKIEVDSNYRLYIFPKKVMLREKKENRWVTRFVSKCPSDVLDSSIIPGDLKQKIKEKLYHFLKIGVKR